MQELKDNLIVKCVSEILDPVTTTDELIPSGETSSFRSNPLGLAEFTLSRKDPAYVGEAKKIRELAKAYSSNGQEISLDANVAEEYDRVIKQLCGEQLGFMPENTSIGSTIYAVKPGDGSAREQAASCQKVLGAWANIAKEYATKRYRSNLINWGMLPFLYDGDEVKKGDYIYIPGIRKAVEEKAPEITAYVVKTSGISKITLKLGELTADERQIILDGCLINYYKH